MPADARAIDQTHKDRAAAIQLRTRGSFEAKGLPYVEVRYTAVTSEQHLPVAKW